MTIPTSRKGASGYACSFSAIQFSFLIFLSLEDVWEKFGRRVPRDFEGHALSISDVVELSDEMASRYFYVEPKGFAEIVFKSE